MKLNLNAKLPSDETIATTKQGIVKELSSGWNHQKNRSLRNYEKQKLKRIYNQLTFIQSSI